MIYHSQNFTNTNNTTNVSFTGCRSKLTDLSEASPRRVRASETEPSQSSQRLSSASMKYQNNQMKHQMKSLHLAMDRTHHMPIQKISPFIKRHHGTPPPVHLASQMWDWHTTHNSMHHGGRTCNNGTAWTDAPPSWSLCNQLTWRYDNKAWRHPTCPTYELTSFAIVVSCNVASCKLAIGIQVCLTHDKTNSKRKAHTKLTRLWSLPKVSNSKTSTRNQRSVNQILFESNQNQDPDLVQNPNILDFENPYVFVRETFT